MIQQWGWGAFMRHVGSIMAEQADKVNWESKQGKALFNLSSSIHKLDSFFQECGWFDYRANEFTPDEYKPLLNEYPPEKT